MAYFIRATASKNFNLNITPSATAVVVGNFELEFRCQMGAGASSFVFASNSTAGANDILFFSSTTNLQVRRGGAQVNFSLPKNAQANLCTYKLVGSLAYNNISVYQDDALLGTLTGSTLWSIIIFNGLINSSRFGDIYFVKLSLNGVLVNHFDPSLPNGEGNVVPDSVGGLSAVMSIAAGDNSQWVFYDGGGGGTDYEITPQAGVFSYTGSAVSIAASRVLMPQAATYTYTGGSVGVLANRLISPQAGQYSYAGAELSLLANRLITPQSGVYAYQGSSIAIDYDAASVTYELTPEPGAFAYTGGPVVVAANRVIAPQAGAYTYTGASIVLVKGYSLTPVAGAYSYQGGNVSLLADRLITPQTGAYTYTGSPVTIDYSGVALLLIDGYRLDYAPVPVQLSYARPPVQLAYKHSDVLLSYKPVSGA
jgi:hypothetical protein